MSPNPRPAPTLQVWLTFLETFDLPKKIHLSIATRLLIEKKVLAYLKIDAEQKEDTGKLVEKYKEKIESDGSQAQKTKQIKLL